jgi:hypothetical protein
VPILYICGSEPAVGKTALAVGIGQWLCRAGIAVRYTRLETEPQHPDAIFATATLIPYRIPRVLDALGQHADVALISAARDPSPVAVPDDVALEQVLSRVSSTEVLIVEGPTARAAAARGQGLILLVAPYRGRETLARIAATGLAPAAVVLNAVPEMYVERAQECVLPALAAQGWTPLGLVPHAQLMLGVPVRALAERLQGRWLCGEEHGDRLVARLAIAGGMLQDALLWLSRRPHNALICKGDRADLPLTALQAGSVAIILTEGLQPGSQVLAGARERGVPVISVRQHAIRVLELIEDLFTAPPVHHPEKAATALALIERAVVLDRLAALLGLAERIGDVAGAR